jgi:hypothetical protein
LTSDATDPSRLTVWASPTEQATIKSILTQIDIEGEAGGATAEVYLLEGNLTITTAASALRLLSTAFPNARFSAGTDANQIVAWASVREHTEIGELIERMNAGPPPDRAPAAVVYALNFVEAAQAQNVLRAAVPNATLTLDPAAPRRLTVWATPTDHKTIETILAQIDVEEATRSELTVVIYSLRDMSSPERPVHLAVLGQRGSQRPIDAGHRTGAAGGLGVRQGSRATGNADRAVDHDPTRR